MARIKYTSPTELYTNKLKDVSRVDLRETNDCTVVAISVACEVPYAQAHKAMQHVGRQSKRCASTYQMIDAMKFLGFQVKEYRRSFWLNNRNRYYDDPVEPEERAAQVQKLIAEGNLYYEIISRYPGQHSTLQNITTHHPSRFPEAWKDLPNMIFCINRHVAGFANGQLHDWSHKNAKQVESILVPTKVEL